MGSGLFSGSDHTCAYSLVSRLRSGSVRFSHIVSRSCSLFLPAVHHHHHYTHLDRLLSRGPLLSTLRTASHTVVDSVVHSSHRRRLLCPTSSASLMLTHQPGRTDGRRISIVCPVEPTGEGARAVDGVCVLRVCAQVPWLLSSKAPHYLNNFKSPFSQHL